MILLILGIALLCIEFFILGIGINSLTIKKNHIIPFILAFTIAIASIIFGIEKIKNRAIESYKIEIIDSYQ